MRRMGRSISMADLKRIEPEFQVFGDCRINIPGPCGLVIFGASGDLSKRKLIPALYRLHRSGLLPEKFFVLGMSRTEMNADQFRELMRSAVKGALQAGFDDDSWNAFAAMLYYEPIEYALSEFYVT